MATAQAPTRPAGWSAPGRSLWAGQTCGAAEMSALLGVSRQLVQHLAQRDDFRIPAAVLAMDTVRGEPPTCAGGCASGGLRRTDRRPDTRRGSAPRRPRRVAGHHPHDLLQHGQ